MVTDGGGHAQFSEPSFEQHSGHMAEELSGFSTSQAEDNTDNVLSVNETMSDIGRVVSQAEAGMDFTTNLDAPMDGVWRHKRAVGPPEAQADDMSMSRFAESYWKPQTSNTPQQQTINDPMLSTNNTHNATAQTNAVEFDSNNEETRSESIYGQTNRHLHALGSFHSDSVYNPELSHLDSRHETEQYSRALPRRPESYHPQLHTDAPSIFSEEPSTGSRLPTFSSQRGQPSNVAEDNSRGRFARLAARYFQQPSSVNGNATNGYAHNPQELSSDDAMSDMPAMPDTPDIHTAFTSDQLSITSTSPSPPPKEQPRPPLPEVSSSLVAQTQTALQMRFAQSHEQQSIAQTLGRTHSQPAISSQQRPQYLRNHRSDLQGETTTGSYQQMGFSMEEQSQESLDHPNMGSQGTLSPERPSIGSITDRDFYANVQQDGIGDGVQYAPMDEFATERHIDSQLPFEPSRDHSFEEHAEHFEPISNADEIFGDNYSSHNSSHPDFSSIMRDHEQVFHDLFHSDDENANHNTISNEFDPTRPPESLFASSASIVAEMSRRRTGEQKRRNFSSWDGHEATPEALRRQEMQYGIHDQNPIERLNKSNSLGIDDSQSEVSGLLPPSEQSSMVGRPGRGYSNSQPSQYNTFSRASANGALNPDMFVSKSPPPPTTPTTIISRDTRHGPSTRVLHRVPMFDDTSSSHRGSIADPINSSTFFKRPAGPRALESNPSRRRPPMLDIKSHQPSTDLDQRNARAAADFASASVAADNNPRNSDGHYSESSSQGLGSLFQDSLPTLDMSRVSRTPNSTAHALSRLVNEQNFARSPLRKANHPDLSSSSLMASHSNYVPFQEPTVDVSQLAKYGTVGMKDGVQWSLRSQEKGVSADRMDNSPMPRKLPLVRDREIYSSVSAYESDGMVPTIRYDSPSPSAGRSTMASPAGHGENGNKAAEFAHLQQQQQQQHQQHQPLNRILQANRPGIGLRASTQSTHVDQNYQGSNNSSGPTLADIYELLKKTASSIMTEKPRSHIDSHGDLPSQQPTVGVANADQSYPDIRPSAPTPRRSRHFPNGTQHQHSESLSSRFQAYMLQQQEPGIDESMVNHDASHMPNVFETPAEYEQSIIDQMHEINLQPKKEASGQAVSDADIDHVITSLGRAVHDYKGMNIPLPLAEKLLELATVLAKARESSGKTAPATRAVDSAVQTADQLDISSEVGAELRRLQQDIVAKFDEYRSEIDMLRAEVRQGASNSSVANSARAHNTSSIVPHDSVSAVAARNFAHNDNSEDGKAQLAEASPQQSRLLTPSPRAESQVRPLFSVPTTTKNRQRHMVQWLNEQDPNAESDNVSEPYRPKYQSASVYGSPLQPRVSSRRKAGKSAEPAGSPASLRRVRDSRRFHTTIQDMADDDEPYQLYGDKDFDEATDDGGLSDASTTVPGSPLPQRPAMRSPVDPAMISPANVPSQRQLSSLSATRRSNPRGHKHKGDDLLATRETLESIRRRRAQNYSDAREDEFGKVVYDSRIAQELATTLAELQRVHISHFHNRQPGSLGKRQFGCPVCESLEAQNHDPYLFGKHAVAYKSMNTRELQGLLNAYVAAMEDEFTKSKRSNGRMRDWEMPSPQPHKPSYQAFTPTRKHARPAAMHTSHSEGPQMVVDLLHEELDALSRRYNRMVAEYHRLDPSNAKDQKRRRHMARELKDLVDLLDVKGEQISVLVDLHPTLAQKKSPLRDLEQPPQKDGCIERAYKSAKALQQALCDLY
ncbi:hypothetical protein IWW36_002031 [Coemansia brasiliensis]|uniref:Cep57 centrosome microtubule-binding domain-containing protein n=1 Tax=Coemansia brasiliensis TaxID=2650707 RepID=A0A9W8M1F9_9FUNG|nr:hypothetical protein IWW36_002031 [Coemansia brasiliensis]